LEETEDQIVAKLVVQKPDEQLNLGEIIPDDLKSQYTQPSPRQAA
jgi:hypothetical protein